VIVTVVRPVASRRLVETGNPSAYATVDCNVCEIAIALCVSVNKNGRNRSDNKIQSSELEPVIYVTFTTLHAPIYMYTHTLHGFHYLMLPWSK
jgi:hypothetical protein